MRAIKQQIETIQAAIEHQKYEVLEEQVKELRSSTKTAYQAISIEAETLMIVATQLLSEMQANDADFEYQEAVEVITDLCRQIGASLTKIFVA